MGEGAEKNPALADVERSYVRTRGQLEWLAAQSGIDERAIAGAVAAAMRGLAIDGVFRKEVGKT